MRINCIFLLISAKPTTLLRFSRNQTRGWEFQRPKQTHLSVCLGEHLPDVTLNELYFVKLSLKSIDLCLDNEFNVKFGVNSSA